MIGLILDVDGFVVDTRNHFVNVYNRVFEKFGAPAMTRDELFSRIKPDYTLILKELGLDSDEAKNFQVDLWSKSLEKNEFGVSLYPGALEFLDEIKNHPFVFATASGRNHIKNYAKIGLDSGFKFVTRDDVANPKPHPDHYAEALRILGTEAEKTIVVDDIGDNLATAREMGMPTLGVTWGFSKEEDFEAIGIPFVDSFDEIVEYVRTFE